MFMGVPPGVTAALGLAVTATLTGALHEDGLADTADGFFGGRTPERRLEIMKDSHIGSFGTLALILVTLARWSALAVLCATGGAAVALIATGVLSRVPMVALMAALPNARSHGLSQSVGRPRRDVTLVAAAIAVVLGLVLGGLTTLWIALALAALTFGLGVLARGKIGGQTGDVLGASQQLAEVLCLALFAAT
jgi:adenosylcobinamide-GDP ribazoletransferase